MSTLHSLETKCPPCERTRGRCFVRADKHLDLRGNQHDSIESETMLYRREIFVKGYQMGINIRVKFMAENIVLLTTNT